MLNKEKMNRNGVMNQQATITIIPLVVILCSKHILR